MAKNFLKVASGVNFRGQGTPPSDPQNGDVYYDTGASTFRFYKNGAWTNLGEETATADTNYIKNPSAQTNTNIWVSAGLMFLSRDTSTSLPRFNSQGTGFAAEGSGDPNDYARYRFTLDGTDLNKKLKVALAANASGNDTWSIQVWKNSASNYAGSYTRLPLSTDVSGESFLIDGNQTFEASFDTDSTPYLELRVKAIAPLWPIFFSNVFVGPGDVVPGTGAGPWRTFTPVVTDQQQVLSGFSNLAGIYRENGEDIDVIMTATKSGAPAGGATGNLNFALPSGYTFANSLIPAAGNINQSLGFANVFSAAGSAQYQAALAIRRNPSYANIVCVQKPASNVVYIGTEMASNSIWTLNFSAPVNELLGRNSFLGNNDVEYAFNSSGITAAGASDTTAFAYGPQGAAIGSINSTTTGTTSSTNFRVQFKTPILATDSIVLELNSGGDVWQEASFLFSPMRQNNALYGVYVSYVNATSVQVVFGNGGCTTSGPTYAATGLAWSTFSTYRWRVKKISGGQAVGFSQATTTQAGLISTQNQSLAGVKTFTEGIKLLDQPQSIVLDKYYEANTVIKFYASGASGNVSADVNIRVIRIGSIVTVNIPAFSVTMPATPAVSNLQTQNPPIPSWARPTTDLQVASGWAMSGGGNSALLTRWNVATSGNLVMHMQNASNFTASQAAGLQTAVSFSYVLPTG